MLPIIFPIMRAGKNSRLTCWIPVARTADLIEWQLGYRVIEAGEIVEVPAHIDPDGPNLIQEISEIRQLGHALIAYWGRANGLSAWVHRGLVVYGTNVTARWKNPDYASTAGNNEAVIHEVFHTLGFRHPKDFSADSSKGLPMFLGPLMYPTSVGSKKVLSGMDGHRRPKVHLPGSVG